MVLRAVSLLMGITSTMVLSLIPGFLVQVLGASALWVGIIEGAAESTACGNAHVASWHELPGEKTHIGA